MAKLGPMRIVVSIPRLVVGAVLAGAAFGSAQLIAPSQQSQTLQSKPTAVKSTTVPYTAASPTVTEAPAITKPVTETVTPKPAYSSTTNTSSSQSIIPSQNAGANELSTTPRVSGYTSTNWAGYFASTNKYTAITGSWTVPKASTSGASKSADATWIGIGGITPKTNLIQVGTMDTFTSSGETVEAFYEMLPSASKIILTTNKPISPGDTIIASLKETSTGLWKISITDASTGQKATETTRYASTGSSAEWIEEELSTDSNTLIPLDNFGSVSFMDATATTTSGENITPALGKAQPITLVSASGNSLAAPSSLGVDGESFTVTQK